MQKKPFISIITPTLNSSKTILRNLESVSNQHFDDFEHIIIDGNSKDDTKLILHKYIEHEVVFQNEIEKGIYPAINQGIKLASGEYIMLLNSDDWLPQDSLKKIYKKISNQIGNLHIFQSKVFENGIEIAKVTAIKDFLPPIQKMPFSHGAMIAKKEFLTQKGLYSTEYSLSSDLDFVNKTAIEDYVYHDDVVHCFSLEGASSQNYQGSKESMKIAIYYGKNPLSARLDYIKVVINKFLGRLIGFSRIIKLKKLLNYSTNWK